MSNPAFHLKSTDYYIDLDWWWPDELPGPFRTDVYTERLVQVWLSFVEDGTDLLLEEVGQAEEGEKPEWFTEELSMGGYDFLDMAGPWSSRDEHGVGRHAQWALENGIAPYQFFRVSIEPPHYYRCSYEYDEWDVEWTTWIDKVIPITDWDAVRRWEHYMMHRRQAKNIDAHYDAWRRHQLLTYPEFMWLGWDSYYPTGTWNYDGSGWPTGTLVRLHSEFYYEGRTNRMCIAEGRSDKGNRKEALSNMLKKAKERIPHIHGNKIRNLPTRPRHIHWEHFSRAAK